MAGIGPLPSISDTQITAMAGGPTLRIETVASEIRGAGFDTTEVALKGTSRLGKALIDTQLAFPLLVQVAQQRQACVFKAKDAHLKSIAGGFDTVSFVLCRNLKHISIFFRPMEYFCNISIYSPPLQQCLLLITAVSYLP